MYCIHLRACIYLQVPLEFYLRVIVIDSDSIVVAPRLTLLLDVPMDLSSTGFHQIKRHEKRLRCSLLHEVGGPRAFGQHDLLHRLSKHTLKSCFQAINSSKSPRFKRISSDLRPFKALSSLSVFFSKQIVSSPPATCRKVKE